MPGKGLMANKDDAWTVFLDEREQLIKFWEEIDKPVFVLSGDLHNSFGIQITDKIWEFASGPHNSNNHPLKFEGGRPINGPFQYGPRPCFIRWSSFALNDVDKYQRRRPMYCVVQVNNTFNSPLKIGGERQVAFPIPQVIFKYFDGVTGELMYSESILANQKK
ncbi:MAG: alkaline phosphatase D family protein, partial [Lentisphaerales bacterium]|nr:alkaline phosphatase D family protein [Lentisphaerales bacterium]